MELQWGLLLPPSNLAQQPYSRTTKSVPSWVISFPWQFLSSLSSFLPSISIYRVYARTLCQALSRVRGRVSTKLSWVFGRVGQAECPSFQSRTALQSHDDWPEEDRLPWKKGSPRWLSLRSLGSFSMCLHLASPESNWIRPWAEAYPGPPSGPFRQPVLMSCHL